MVGVNVAVGMRVSTVVGVGVSVGVWADTHVCLI